MTDLDLTNNVSCLQTRYPNLELRPEPGQQSSRKGSRKDTDQQAINQIGVTRHDPAGVRIADNNLDSDGTELAGYLGLTTTVSLRFWMESSPTRRPAAGAFTRWLFKQSWERVRSRRQYRRRFQIDSKKPYVWWYPKSSPNSVENLALDVPLPHECCWCRKMLGIFLCVYAKASSNPVKHRNKKRELKVG